MPSRRTTPYEVYADPADAAVARWLGQSNLLPARVTNGVATTALGELRAPDATDGAVEILVRPESIRATRDPTGNAAFCTSSSTGTTSLSDAPSATEPSST